jgi:hypothetical protein
MAYAFNHCSSNDCWGSSANEISPDQFELGLEMEVNPAGIARLRGGRVGKALAVLDVDVALTSDGRISLKKSIPGDLGAQLVYDGQGSFRLTSPLGSVDLMRSDVDMLFGPNPPFGPGWEAGFTAQLDPKFVLKGNFLVGSIGISTTVRTTPQQQQMLRNRNWWLQNLTGGAPIGMGPGGE